MTDKQMTNWKKEFDKRFVTYPAFLACESWGGSKKNRTYKNSSILVKNYKKPYLTVRAIKTFIQQTIDQAVKERDEEWREAVYEGLNDGLVILDGRDDAIEMREVERLEKQILEKMKEE